MTYHCIFWLYFMKETEIGRFPFCSATSTRCVSLGRGGDDATLAE